MESHTNIDVIKIENLYLCDGEEGDSLGQGVPSCAECRIKVLAGESNLIPPNKAELSLIGTSYYIDGRRLACQIHAYGDISVDITDHLDKDDNTNKKIRGFRPAPGQSRESKAVQGTLVLQEPEAAPPARAERAPSESRGPRPQQRGGHSAGPQKAGPVRGAQVPHPGDSLVAGQEHHETTIADLDGSGDEGIPEDPRTPPGPPQKRGPGPQQPRPNGPQSGAPSGGQRRGGRRGGRRR